MDEREREFCRLHQRTLCIIINSMNAIYLRYKQFSIVVYSNVANRGQDQRKDATRSRQSVSE